MAGLVADLWVNTDEWVPSVTKASHDPEQPQVQPRHEEAAIRGSSEIVQRIHFAVGLWTVCPSYQDGRADHLNGVKPKNYQESNFACSSISISRILDTSDLSWRQDLGLWSPAYNTFRIIDNIRICALFAMSSLALMIISTLLATLGHCVRGHKMLLASGLYALGGLLLGCCLLILVCTISEEFGPSSSTASSSASTRSKLFPGSSTASPLKAGDSKMNFNGYEGGRDQYSYGWSFILATLGFLGSELSALLCLAAFLNRFDSEEDFIKMLPGMERRLTEHMMVHHCTTASEDSGRSLQEVPLLKGSFGHHSAIGNSSSQESLYGNNQHQQPHIMPTSESIHSFRGHMRGATIPIMAEIVPVTHHAQHRSPPQQQQHFEASAASEVMGVDLVSSASAGGGCMTSSSFMPVGSASTLPRSLENGYITAASRLQSVNSRLTTSPVLVDTHMRPSSMVAMATMPRKMSNGYGGHVNSAASPPSMQPLTKKKSVTIGTFTTVVEPYEEEEDENLISSAV